MICGISVCHVHIILIYLLVSAVRQLSWLIKSPIIIARRYTDIRVHVIAIGSGTPWMIERRHMERSLRGDANEQRIICVPTKITQR
jgi:hypothetical protein